MAPKLLPKKPFPPSSQGRPEPQAARNIGKVTPPRAHGVYANERLFHRLDDSTAKPIVWIHAPPGAGKTTLAASYLANKRIDPLWYRLDEADTDPATLFLYLSAAWKGRKMGRSLPVLTPDKRAGLPIFARQFFREMFRCPKTSVLVFDDYHEVAPDSPLHQCVASGVEELPDGCRVVFVSRAPPPPAFAKLRMNGHMDVLEPEALRLTLDEAKGVAQERGADVQGADVEAIVQRTQGWTAGLILMLDAGTDALVPAAHATETSEVLFDYFAGEILDRMPPERRRLLCVLALMPTMTAAAANRLTDTPEAEALLEDLRRRNYFTVRDTAAEPRYRFHPLFRDFLLAQSGVRLSSDELNRLRVRAAEALDADGQAEDAVGLFEEAGAFVELADLVIRRADALFLEGRFETIGAWLKKINRAIFETKPWLVYWAGSVFVYHKPTESLELLAKAFELFRQAGDVIGQFTTWARQAEAVRTDAFGDNRRFDALYDAMHDLLARHPDIPPGRVMLNVALSMAVGLQRRSNKRDEIAFWQKQARAAERESTWEPYSSPVDYWFAIGDLHDGNFKQARDALGALPNPLGDDPRARLVNTSGHIAYAAALLYRQTTGDCGAFCNETIRRMEASGSFMWTHQLAAIAANEAYRRGDLAACETWLRRTGECADHVTTIRGSHYYYTAAQFNLGIGNFETALTHADTGIAFGDKSGWHFFEVLSRLVRAEIFLEMERLDEAEVELLHADEVQAQSATRGVAFGTLLLKADLAFARGDEQAGLARLSEALALGRKQGDRSTAIRATRSGRLLTTALKADIQTDFVREFIRWSGIVAPVDADDIWPWPLKIRTLGSFAITQHGEPLTFGRKTPKRLVMLLKAIIAYGGRDVPEEKLIDALWPDEDGDAAHSALTIAIHRLRKLLGDASLVIVKGGKVGLDPARCWLDSWAFERKLSPRKADEAPKAYEGRRREGLDLYRGDFLPDDEDLWWTAERRDALRKRLQRALAPA